MIGTPKVSLVEGSAKSLRSPLDGSDVLSDYDDLSFLMYTDREVAQIISKLEKKKLEAVNTERFEYAKKIKTALGELQEAGLILGSLEMEKQILADSQVGQLAHFMLCNLSTLIYLSGLRRGEGEEDSDGRVPGGGLQDAGDN